jgi:hypothetical protein
VVRLDLVKHGQPAGGLVDGCLHVHIADADFAAQRGELVKVGSEKGGAADFLHQVLADGPREAEAVVGGRASAQLVDDDKAARCGALRKRVESGVSANRQHGLLNFCTIFTALTGGCNVTIVLFIQRPVHSLVNFEKNVTKEVDIPSE